MTLNNIPLSGLWRNIAGFVNQNFEKLMVALHYVENGGGRMFVSLSALQEAIENPQNGMWAYVSSTLSFPAHIYTYNGTAWIDGGSVSAPTDASSVSYRGSNVESELDALKDSVVDIDNGSTSQSVVNIDIDKRDGTSETLSIPTATISSAGVMSASQVSQLNTVNNKLNAPSQIGTNGQVLKLNENLVPIWANETGGGSYQGKVVAKDSAGNAFSTFAEFESAKSSGIYYYGGALYSPIINDYCFILSDSTHYDKQAKYIVTALGANNSPVWSFHSITEGSDTTYTFSKTSLSDRITLIAEPSQGQTQQVPIPLADGGNNKAGLVSGQERENIPTYAEKGRIPTINEKSMIQSLNMTVNSEGILTLTT